MNTGKSAESKGAGCAKNEFMYMVTQHAIHKYHADVILIENAPALYTNKGKPVAKRLFEIGKENGYSLTLYKTSTVYHGIPQNRDRCFAILWRSPTAPIMSYYKRDRKNFKEYLKEISSTATQQHIINENIVKEPYFSFLEHKFKKDPREILIADDVKTTFNYVNDNNLLDECIEWFKETNNERGLKYALHAKNKFSQGLGIWDGSVHVFGEYMNAVIGRNMVDTIHPEYDRSLTLREAMHLMGLPENFEVIGGLKNLNHVAQNVPTCTARDMVLEAIKFVEGNTTNSGHDYFMQNNHTEKGDSSRSSNEEIHVLVEFFTDDVIVDTI